MLIVSGRPVPQHMPMADCEKRRAEPHSDWNVHKLGVALENCDKINNCRECLLSFSPEYFAFPSHIKTVILSVVLYGCENLSLFEVGTWTEGF